MENVNNIELNKTEIAAVFGITTRRISQLVADGILEQSEGKFRLAECVQAYVAFCKGKLFDDVSLDSEKRRRNAEADLKAAKARIAKAEADELEGRMHRSEDVEALMMDFTLAVRAGLLALPSRLAVDVAGKQASEAAAVIKQEVFRLLEELSTYRYDPKAYADRVRERRNMAVTTDE